jgi:glutathione gamma-glutamylcysteinyltransferase
MDGSYHRRELKSPAIAFSSIEGRQIFAESLSTGHMDAYFNLSEQFTTQSQPTFCGIGSLTMSLNALLVDPMRVWQGVWRWFDDSMMDCCTPLDIVRLKGITISQLACLAKCNGAKVSVNYASDVDENQFRKVVAEATRANFDEGKGQVIIVSYSRSKLNQSGSGHFSPIGGYHPQRDLVLIMDVARFKV